MQRFTISLDDALAKSFDELAQEQGYRSRSEAFRDLVRGAVEERRHAGNLTKNCIANLSYAYDHRTRGIAGRLSALALDHHDLVLSTSQAPLDHETFFASTMLKGATSAVRRLADEIRAERGVRFGKLNILSVEPNDRHHGHGDHHHHGGAHLSPPRG